MGGGGDQCQDHNEDQDSVFEGCDAENAGAIWRKNLSY